MQYILYIKYSELTLKNNNRKEFIKILFNNIKYSLQEFGFQISYHYDYIQIYDFDPKDVNNIIDILKETPGIHSINIAYKLQSLDEIQNLLLNDLFFLKQYKTFKVITKRQNKNFYLTSDQINRLIATSLLENSNLKVDIHNPDINIKIEVKNNFILFWYKSINGTNGLPIGSSGKTICLISGGIDSPVASKLMMERGTIPIFLTFITPPHTCSESLDKVVKLVKKITHNFKLHKSIRLLICNYTNVMHELSHIKNQSYKITLMRRSFFRIAQSVAKKYNCLSLTTGESLGQVASQTQESMATISNVLNDIIVYRPLIGLDKNTIITYAKKYHTYDISILNFPDSCSLFAPKHPITKPNINNAKEYEQEIFLLDELEKNIIDNIYEYKY